MEPLDPASAWRILLIEDHADTRRSLEQWLVKHGHSVFPASCGSEALEVMRLHPDIQVVLSDIGLPDGSGWELLPKLAAVRNSLPPPAIAMSGFGTLDDCARSTAAGFILHLVKPFRLAELREALQSLMRPGDESEI